MQETIASMGALGYNILLILVKMGKIFVAGGKPSVSAGKET